MIFLHYFQLTRNRNLKKLTIVVRIFMQNYEQKDTFHHIRTEDINLTNASKLSKNIRLSHRKRKREQVFDGNWSIPSRTSAAYYDQNILVWWSLPVGVIKLVMPITKPFWVCWREEVAKKISLPAASPGQIGVTLHPPWGKAESRKKKRKTSSYGEWKNINFPARVVGSSERLHFQFPVRFPSSIPPHLSSYTHGFTQETQHVETDSMTLSSIRCET